MNKLTIIKKLAAERDNLSRLLDACEARERLAKRVRQAVIQVAHGDDVMCWCQFGIGNLMVKAHSPQCEDLYVALYGRKQ